jgi:hypothetical protein
MWRRQLSTFDRSSKRGSRVGVEVISLMRFTWFVVLSTNPSGFG